MNINNTVRNRKILRSHAREMLAKYSPVMTWLVLDDNGDLWEIVEPQGQSEYVGNDTVLATTGGFDKSHGAYVSDYRTQREYLFALLGDQYNNLFNR